MRGHKIEAVIFDRAGTTVDYGCFAPVNAFNEAFKKFGIAPTVSEIREPMGMLKIDHIRTMLNMNRISGLWKEIYGRPYPYMIFENMKRLEIMSTGSVIKVGDTVSDIREGKNAGVWTVGVIEGSSESGLTEREFSSLSESEKKQLAQKVENKFSDSGADFVISNISEICDIIDKINLSGND
ncbi:MAG: hypothetical protein LUC97_02305 [Clostridiales bacterium]|nr:hypothetical protein [Clostridiales bacterium]